MQVERMSPKVFNRISFFDLDKHRKETLCKGFLKTFPIPHNFATQLQFTAATTNKLMQDVDRGLFTRENFPVMVAFMEGKPIKIENNVLCLQGVSPSFIPSDLVSLDYVFKALIKRWFVVPSWLYCLDLDTRDLPKVGIEIHKDSIQFSVKESSDVEHQGMNDYTFTFSTTIRLGTPVDSVWRPELYCSEKKVKELNRLKFLWDLIHSGDRLALIKTTHGHFVISKNDKDASQIDDYTKILGIQLDQTYASIMLKKVSLMGELVADTSLRESAKKINEFYGDEMPILWKLATLFGKNRDTFSVNSLDAPIELLKDLLEGFQAVKEISTRYAKATGQTKKAPLVMGLPAAKLFVEKIQSNPLLYTEDHRECVARIAQKMVCGV